MTFRYARHTNDLIKIEQFYTEIVGLEKLGHFENHNNYNGIFLGQKNSNWHLEFTNSSEQPKSKFDEDDILVFYVNSQIELTRIKQTIENKCITLEVSQNPYWNANGIYNIDKKLHLWKQCRQRNWISCVWQKHIFEQEIRKTCQCCQVTILPP